VLPSLSLPRSVVMSLQVFEGVSVRATTQLTNRSAISAPMFRTLSLPTVTRLVEKHRRQEDRIERHSTARLSFRIKGAFCLEVHVICAYSSGVLRTFVVRFPSPPDAGCFKRRSVQGIARLLGCRGSFSKKVAYSLPLFWLFYQLIK
jgi:hypothetical protein